MLKLFLLDNGKNLNLSLRIVMESKLDFVIKNESFQCLKSTGRVEFDAYDGATLTRKKTMTVSHNCRRLNNALAITIAIAMAAVV